MLFLVSITGLAKISWLLSRSSVAAWRQEMVAPFFMPPGWVFALVWPVLYLTLGLAAWQLWQQRQRVNINGTMLWFCLQLLLNFAWLPLSACGKSSAFILGLLVVLVILGCLNCWQFYQVDTVAGLLLLPYLIWLGFVLVLTCSYVILNHPALATTGMAQLFVRS